VAGGNGLFIAADALIHASLSFRYPSWRVPIDHEPSRAARTRLNLLDRLARRQTPILGYHFPPPGLGLAERNGDSYRFMAL
jgi:glyoxylase-like metal-dependent hydrolase (beta-lactamase superfamily II)